ncbi:sugar-transfer associated ATP-grasp domain-containing protein [uncultured Draconibacterium sp.]|uniref:sugar-transfer associated ATP-grasp domain-containing protein n=1 Tax=uncultured Draconibacterium sp. TaxID=1573823 RepID=UPI0029C73534|nr:sugar-transfer associated ATP-grasp domain-containing protein [uncultured Draconibacterium sp.]
MNISSLKKGVSLMYFYGLSFLDRCIYHGGKTAGRLIFPVVLIQNWKLYVKNQSYYPECKLKGELQIFLEQLLYIFRTGEINKKYFFFGLDRKTHQITKNYIPWLKFAHARNSKNQHSQHPQYDPYNFVCLLRDKFVFEGFCKGVGINTPSNIAMINNGVVFIHSEKKFVQLENLIDYDFDTFCKREVSYGGGMPNDILKLQIKNKEIVINNNSVPLQKFKDIIGNDRWIVQERITNQSTDYAIFHPNSINTIRVVTIRDNDEIQILCAIFRMGANGRHSDNWSSGGISVGINIEDGTLEKWGFFKPGLGTKSDKHPNTGIVYENKKLPLWQEIIEYVKKAHQLFYGLHSIGWDVAVTDSGIMLIEGNDNWDTDFAQWNNGKKDQYNKYFR